MKDADPVFKRIGPPVRGYDKSDEAFIVVEDNGCELNRDSVPSQGKLNKIMFDRTVGILEVSQANTDLAFV